MKNKGFTLVELLAVIVILGVLITIAAPNVLGTSKKARQKMYESKVEMIVKAAVLYGEDNYDLIKESGTKKVTITNLLQGNYLKKEDNGCNIGNGCIKDPRDNASMDNKNLCICIVNKRIRASYIGNDTNCTVDKCKSNNTYETN